MTFLQSLISKKKVLFIGGNRKQKKKWREKYLRGFLETHFPIILSDSNSMYVYVLTTCSMIFLNVKTEHSMIRLLFGNLIFTVFFDVRLFFFLNQTAEN